MLSGVVALPASLLASGCALPTSGGGITPAGAAGPGVFPLQTPRIRERDRWVYDEVNRYNGQLNGQLSVEVVAVDPLVRVRLQHSGRAVPPAEESYHSGWNAVRESHFDEPIEFRDPIPTLTSVLAPGARERIVTDYRPQNSERRYRWHMYVDTRTWERIRVPAGEFDCLRIERRIWFVHPDPYRFNSERFETLWYSPRVNRWVQREWTGQYTIPGGRRGTLGREDWVRWSLREHVPAPISS